MSEHFTPEEVEALRRLAKGEPIASAVLDELSRDPNSARAQMRALLKLSDISLPLSRLIKRAENIRWLLSSAAWLAGGFALAAAAIVQATQLMEWIENWRNGGPPSQPP